MPRLRSAAVLALLAACAPPRPLKPNPGTHTCYRTTGPLISASETGVRWLTLSDRGEVFGARWYSGTVVGDGREEQPVQWQSSGAGAFRVRWGNDGTMDLAEVRGALTGTARSGAQSWRVTGLREACPREF